MGVIGYSITGTIGFFTKKSGLPPANPGSGFSVVSVNSSLDTINPSGNITFSEHTLYHHPVPPILQGGSNSPVVSNSGQQNFLDRSLYLQTFNTLNTEALTPPSLELISEAINTLSQEEVIKPQLVQNLKSNPCEIVLKSELLDNLNLDETDFLILIKKYPLHTINNFDLMLYNNNNNIHKLSDICQSYVTKDIFNIKLGILVSYSLFNRFNIKINLLNQIYNSLDSVCKFYEIPSKDLLFIVNKIINLTPEDFSNFLKDYYFINLHLGSNNKHKDLIKKLETEIMSIRLYINNDSKKQGI
jgi:hypothetical protein